MSEIEKQVPEEMTVPEETAAPEAEETLPAAAETDADETADAPEEEEEIEEDAIPMSWIRGVNQVEFRCMALGAALALIITGLLGVADIITNMPSSTTICIVGIVIGFGVGKLLTRKIEREHKEKKLAEKN